MATINTADDLIEVLRSDDRVRSAVRRELLTDEVVALPDKVDKMVEAQTAMQESLTAMQQTQDSMLKTQTAILKDIKGIRKEQKSLRKEQTSLRKEHKADRVESIQDMHRFRGNYAASAAVKRRKRIAGPFARLWQMRQVKCQVLSADDVDALADGKFDDLTKLGFTDEDVNLVSEADLVIGVRGRRRARPEFYVVVEAAYTGDESDVERAIVRARIVAAATGLATYAVVASVHLHPAATDRVTEDASKSRVSDGATSAFWYKIVERDMEPASPR